MNTDKFNYSLIFTDMKTNYFNQNMVTKVKMLIIIAFTFFSCLQIKADKAINGVVTDKGTQMPLPGVNVNIVGSMHSTITDVNGLYKITLPEKGAKLQFSYVGYKAVTINVKDTTYLNVELEQDISELDEVVVVGYGAQKKSMVTGAVSAVKYGYLSRALQGKACGVSIASENSYTQTYYNPSEETYSQINENGYKQVKMSPLSTFSIDVDKASYTNVRRFINQGKVPPQDAVRIEEMINYFSYNYPQPKDKHPFSINTEYANCPWDNNHKLLHIGIQGKTIATDNLPPSNLVFLIDVSGSMGEPNKLPLVQSAFKLLVNNLREQDHVAIVVYAGAAGVVLPSTRGCNKEKIIDALNGLQAGGSTAGGEGIELAYKIAKENFIREGNNRVILATDGDFNVGISNENELEDFIVEKRKTGVFLTCMGFGMGNYKDSKMETLADKGNGNYAYIDDLTEANKVFVNEFGGTLFTIAKDVKIQIEFNPSKVQAYRLVGYENRMLNNEDFKDDSKDAGELGSGHTVTAIYEIIPTGVNDKYVKDIDALKYQKNSTPLTDENDEVATVKFRYKLPDGDESIEMIRPIGNNSKSFEEASENLKFASAVAMFGMVLRNSEYKGNSDYNSIIKIANTAKSYDPDGYRGEFVRLVKISKGLNFTADNE